MLTESLSARKLKSGIHPERIIFDVAQKDSCVMTHKPYMGSYCTLFI